VNTHLFKEGALPKVSEAQLEQRRQQLLDAAVACFARKGFHQATMADIAAEAGVSDTLAYRYFGGKEEIIDAAVRRYGDTTAKEVLAAFDSPDDPFALVDMLLASGASRFNDRQAAKATMGMHFQSWAAALHQEPIRQEVVSRWRHHFDIAASLVRRGQEAGQLNSDIDASAVARVMLALHYGLSLFATLDPDTDLDGCHQVALAMFKALEVDQVAGGEDSRSGREENR
jgi:AcrR family transcriptional regulator